jgi:hypothetical protein
MTPGSRAVLAQLLAAYPQPVNHLRIKDTRALSRLIVSKLVCMRPAMKPTGGIYVNQHPSYVLSDHGLTVAQQELTHGRS